MKLFVVSGPGGQVAALADGQRNEHCVLHERHLEAAEVRKHRVYERFVRLASTDWSCCFWYPYNYTTM